MSRAILVLTLVLPLVGCGDNSNTPSPWVSEANDRIVAIRQLASRCGASPDWASGLTDSPLTIDVQRAIQGQTVAVRGYVVDLAESDGSLVLTVESFSPRLLWRMSCSRDVARTILSRVEESRMLYFAMRVDSVRTAQELMVYEFMDPEWQATPLAIGSCVGVSSGRGAAEAFRP